MLPPDTVDMPEDGRNESGKFSSTQSRRTILKSAASAGSILTGISAMGSASATHESFDAHDSHRKYVSGGGGGGGAYYRDEIGAGLRHLQTNYGTYSTFYVFEFGAEGTVVEDSSGEFPVNSDEYHQVNDDCYPPLHSANVDGQGFLIEGDASLHSYVENDGDEVWMHPPSCSAERERAAKITKTVLETAIGAIPKVGVAAGALINATQLYNALQEDSQDRQDGRVTYYNGILRGGFGGRLVIEVDSGEFGNVSLTTEFGGASTGFDIFVDDNSYSVTPKDATYD